MSAPASIEAIAQAGLPSARTTELSILDSIYTGKNATTILKYVTAYPILFCDAPQRLSIWFFKGKKSAINATPQTSVTVIQPPTDLSSFCVSPLP